MDGVQLEILPQPDDTTCGPTCLHAVYRYFGEATPLSQVIDECTSLDGGGTLAAYLGCHALKAGYRATMYTFNLRVFDPTWFANKETDLEAKLLAQMEHKKDPKLQTASRAYIEFVQRGGEIRMEDLTRQLLRKYLNQSTPILVGLSSTFLYRDAREKASNQPDDVNGLPTGHFVVLCGYDRQTKQVRVADPYLPNPIAPRMNYYLVDVDRVVCSIMLGILTYDANLLIIRPKQSTKGH